MGLIILAPSSMIDAQCKTPNGACQVNYSATATPEIHAAGPQELEDDVTTITFNGK